MSIDGIVDKVSEGMLAVVDGCDGICILEPDADVVAEYEAKRETYWKEQELLQIYRGKETVTADGIKAALLWKYRKSGGCKKAFWMRMEKALVCSGQNFCLWEQTVFRRKKNSLQHTRKQR